MSFFASSPVSGLTVRDGRRRSDRLGYNDNSFSERAGQVVRMFIQSLYPVV